MELTELYLQLFISFLKIGLFGFGGGYAMLPLIQREVVDIHGWISVNDFTDIVAISQTTPGPIAFNSATYIGYTAITEAGYSTGYGILGSAISTLAVSIPSLILMTLVCLFFFRLKNNPWLQSSLSVLKLTIIGLIASAALMLMNEHNFIDYKSWIIFTIIMIASIRKVDPILLIVLSGIAGLILY
ncbi:MAG TPA: chromate transporter [Fermentimonas caenicola]|jgi:chromate transporter|uniref:Chromate transporter n=1 Tax=Fermentimonas caenicola TaxID=1562970 RepID=A0A098BY13_9BACT|nr:MULTISPECIES: chromate transporter [Lascolabacillus]MBP6174654.1 chromate transporter [Fermentimonas sp.]MDI9624997.1 chromate transporter [Bacteroidota bacterium]TAH61588.1 MAG: chromate transporter [Fermentimonas caenicola]MBP6195944.1 chromate transporter [Fermentimonas sp.]MBP7104930.1 chromate transporter [Fermentimonas sp.]